MENQENQRLKQQKPLWQPQLTGSSTQTNQPRKTLKWRNFQIYLSEVTEFLKDHVGINPPYKNLHFLRSWRVSEGVRVLQALKRETGVWSGPLPGFPESMGEAVEDKWPWRPSDWVEDEKVPPQRPCVSNCDRRRVAGKLRMGEWVKDQKPILILISYEGKDPKFLFKH